MSSFDRGRFGAGARGNDDVLCLKVVAFRHDGVRVDESRLALHPRDSIIFEVSSVYPVEVFDVSIYPFTDRCPAWWRGLYGKTHVSCFMKGSHDRGRIVPKLFGYASPVDACSAETIVLDEGNTLSVRGSSSCRGKSTASSSDDNQVVDFHGILGS